MKDMLLVLLVLATCGCGSGRSSPSIGPAALNAGSREVDSRVWTSRCTRDRFTDQSGCTVSAAVLGRGTPFMAGTISSNDGGRTWVVSVTPAPRAIRIRVDARQALTIPCGSPAGPGLAGVCAFDAADSRRLTAQFRNGRQIAFEAQLPTGPVDADFTADGFTEALKAASSGKNS